MKRPLISASGSCGRALVLLAGLGSVVVADDEVTGPEGVLAEKRLTRQGLRYVLDDEAEVMRALPAVKQVVAQAEAAHRKVGVVGAEAGQLEQLRAQIAALRSQIDQMNVVIRQMPGAARRNPQQNQYIAQRDRLRTQLSNLDLQIRNARLTQPPPPQQSQGAAEADRLRGVAASRVEELHGRLVAVEESYRTLLADTTVKEAVDELNRKNRTALKIAPGDAFLRARQWAERVKALIGPPPGAEDEAPAGRRPGRRGPRAEPDAAEPGPEAAEAAESGPGTEAGEGQPDALAQLGKAAALFEGLDFGKDDPESESREAARVRTLGLVNEAIEAFKAGEKAADLVTRAIASQSEFAPAGMTGVQRRALREARERLAAARALLRADAP